MSALRPGFGRAALGAAGVVALLALAGRTTTATAARANDLPAQLLAASRLMPIGKQGRQACLWIAGLRNELSLAAVLGEQSSAAAGSDAYSASTQGAYLGSGPVGTPAPPFVQALLDAGAAVRLTLTWTRHTRVPTMAVPQLQDLATIRSATDAEPQAPFVERDVRSQGDAYLVIGPDRDLFSHDGADILAPRPPAVTAANGANSAHDGPNASSPPSGVWTTARLCYALVPDRVLEYGDVVDHGNGLSEISAAVLFRPERVPSWISDPRVIGALRPNMKPLDIRIVSFRNYGDGWRPTGFLFSKLVGKTHVVSPAR